MIGSKREHDRSLVPPQRVDSAVTIAAAMRLEQDICLDVDRIELFGDKRAVLLIGDDDW
jgi:hypothetical protein